MIETFNDYVVVEMPSVTDTSTGGIILPDQIVESPKEATVVSVGSSVKENLSTGDVIYFHGNMNTIRELTIEGESVHVLKIGEIYGKQV